MFPRVVEAVLFDLDGVLVDSFRAWVEVLDACRLRRDLPPLGEAGLRRYWGQGIAADCETLFPGAHPEQLAEEYELEFLRHLDAVQTIDGAAALLAELERTRVRMAVVTNSPRALAARVLDQVEFSSAFEVICGGDEVTHGKPDPALVSLALSRLGIEAAHAVMIGDTTIDVGAARAAGVHIVGYGIAGDSRVDSVIDLLALLDRSGSA